MLGRCVFARTYWCFSDWSFYLRRTHRDNGARRRRQRRRTRQRRVIVWGIGTTRPVAHHPVLCRRGRDDVGVGGVEESK
jgi:hypothetical protein